MNQRQSELDQFLSYLQNERHYSAKTVLAYQTDLHEAERFWHENGGFPGWTKVRERDIQVYLQHLAERKLARSSQLRKMSSPVDGPTLCGVGAEWARQRRDL